MDTARIDELVGAAAYRCRRRWSHMDLEDLRQEMYLWVYEHPRLTTEMLNEADTTRADRDFTSNLLNAGERLARKDRADRMGYEVEDEHFYSTATLRDLLPLVLDKETWAVSGVSNEEKVNTGTDPAEGGNLVAMLSDVSRALDTLKATDREILIERYLHGESEAQVAERLGLTTEALQARTNRAIGRLRRLLGGKRPDVVESEREYVGTRKVLSNAAACALTSHQGEQ